jgi:hypothetical protein
MDHRPVDCRPRQYAILSNEGLCFIGRSSGISTGRQVWAQGITCHNHDYAGIQHINQHMKMSVAPLMEVQQVSLHNKLQVGGLSLSLLYDMVVTK